MRKETALWVRAYIQIDLILVNQEKMSKNAVSMLPLPKFKGEQEKFGMYNMQIKAHLTVKRIDWILNKKVQDKLPAREDMILDPTNPYEKAQMVVLEKNAMAIAIPVNSFTNKLLLNKIHDAKWDDWPSWLA